MPLHKVLVDDFYDTTYKLVAIHSNMEDYRLAYILNKSLGLALQRKVEDIDFPNENISYSIFEYEPNEYITWNLVSNICKKVMKNTAEATSLFQTKDTYNLKYFYLIPEYKKTYYFLKISDEINAINEALITTTLQSIPQIVTSYFVNPKHIKSKDHLIF